MMLTIQPMTPDCARTLLAWRYPPPYDLYNHTVAAADLDEEIAFFCDPEHHYYALQTEDGHCVGFACAGAEARVPGGDYSLAALDVGLGLAPEWTGRGLGAALLQSVLHFLAGGYPAPRDRVTIAAFNRRAQRAAERCGFAPAGRFSAAGGMEYLVYIRERSEEGA